MRQLQAARVQEPAAEKNAATFFLTDFSQFIS
jgi:hypothetical protein